MVESGYVCKQVGTSLSPRSSRHQRSTMRLAVSLPIFRVLDFSKTVARKRDFHRCCLDRHSQKPADKFIVFQRGSHRNCRTVRAKDFADAMSIQVINHEDADYLDYSTISGDMTTGSDHVSDIVCLAEDNERLLFRLKPMYAAGAHDVPPYLSLRRYKAASRRLRRRK